MYICRYVYSTYTDMHGGLGTAALSTSSCSAPARPSFSFPPFYARESCPRLVTCLVCESGGGLGGGVREGFMSQGAPTPSPPVPITVPRPPLPDDLLQ